MRLSESKSSRPIVRDIAESLGKLPPQDLRLEEAILGAILIEKNALDDIMFLKAEHFYSEQHQTIFEAIDNLIKAHKPVDILNVVSELRSIGKLELVGGAYYISELTSRVSSSANIESHSRTIYEYALKRELIQIASLTHHDAYEDTTDVFELIDKLSKLIFELTAFQESGQAESILEIAKRQVISIGERMRMTGPSGLITGFNRLDRATNGWQPTDLIVVAADSSMGKTALVCSSIRITARKHPVAVFSLEMSKEQLYNRIIGMENEIDVSSIQSGKIGEHEYHLIVSDHKRAHELKIYIDDTPSITITQLRKKARRLIQLYGIQEIVVDYIQLMAGEDTKGKTREQIVASISSGLKSIAKELKVPVIALSQLSRANKIRGGDKRPQLSDLRDSGAIEQDADLVIFLYRPEYHKMKTVILPSGEEISSEGFAELIIAKFRKGSLQTIPLTFKANFTKFIDYEARPTIFSKSVKNSAENINVNQNIEPKVDPDKVPF